MTSLGLVQGADHRVFIVDRTITDKGPLNRTVGRIEVEVLSDGFEESVIVTIRRNDKEACGPVSVVMA